MVEYVDACSRCAGIQRVNEPGGRGDAFGIRSDRGVNLGAHQRHSLRHERLDPGGLSRDGAQPNFTPHRECRCAFEHWTGVRWNSSGILRAVCEQFVKIAETEPPRSSTFRTTRPEKMGACDG